MNTEPQMPLLRAETNDKRTWTKVFERDHYNLADLTGLRILDIGAHVGAFSCKAAHRGAESVVAVEPSPESFAILSTNTRALNSVSCRLAALDAEDNRFVGVTGTMEGDAARVATDVSHYNTHDFIVPSVSLPTLAQAFDGRPVDLLKLDCQGAEWAAFRTTPAAFWDRVHEVIGEIHTDLHFSDFLAFANAVLKPDQSMSTRTDWTSRAIALDAITRFFETRGFLLDIRLDPEDPYSADFHARRPGRACVSAL
ncbi:FkbM family methyltransferase [Thalassococcus sp. S3]|uniref:FkbM family methyltransferase n=1 Tax=Thalassococcus sp. S3 TaxID=2017482 RepID=UPI00102408FE|nr:FkbM family methyltransferase [Thalassococcus sp. S3]QBF29646.1 hypothetical protein CFI11_00250 [Thalassococcus sp. S3]